MSCNKFFVTFNCICVLLTLGAADLAAQIPVKNIIFMVPAGMGLSYVTATRIKKNGVDGRGLFFERLEQIGYQKTHSANSIVTDSAAAASAWAAGSKFVNGEISQFGQGGEDFPHSGLQLPTPAAQAGIGSQRPDRKGTSWLSPGKNCKNSAVLRNCSVFLRTEA